MATPFYLTNTASDVDPGAETELALALTRGSGVVSSTATATAAGPTAGVQLQVGGVVASWLSTSLNAVTISGQLTCNLWGFESATQANTGFEVLIERCNSAGTVISTITRTESLVELGTSSAVRNWQMTPASAVSLNAGDRIKVTVFGNDAGGNMASGRTFTLRYHGSGAAADGDSYVSFAETITALTALSPTGSDTDTLTGTDASSLIANDRKAYVTWAALVMPTAGSADITGSDSDTLAGSDSSASLTASDSGTDLDTLTGTDASSLSTASDPRLAQVTWVALVMPLALDQSVSASDADVLTGIDASDLDAGGDQSKTAVDVDTLIGTDASSFSGNPTDRRARVTWAALVSPETLQVTASDTDTLTGVDTAQLIAPDRPEADDNDVLEGTEVGSVIKRLYSTYSNVDFETTTGEASTYSLSGSDADTLTGSDASEVANTFSAADADTLDGVDVGGVVADDGAILLTASDVDDLIGTDTSDVAELVETVSLSASDVSTLVGVDASTWELLLIPPFGRGTVNGRRSTSGLVTSRRRGSGLVKTERE